MRGNVVDLAVGVVIGVAFGAIVASLVVIIMPIIGAATGGLDFSNYYISLSSKVQAGAQFLTVALNFLIVAAVLFLGTSSNERKKRHPRPRSRLPTSSY
jgi:large conductance mechanosensitive channel